jgi:cbb3-type cytochrome oxidase subunit 1
MSYEHLFTPRDTRNYQVFSAWMILAGVSFAVVTVLIGEKFLEPGVLAWSLTGLTILFLIVAMRKYILFLRDADELLRKIHLEALAFAFGAGAVTMMGYRLLERLGAPKLDVNDAFVVMMLVWVAGQWLGARRYATNDEEVAQP